MTRAVLWLCAVDGREVQYDAKNQSPNALCEQIYYDCMDLMMADENA